MTSPFGYYVYVAAQGRAVGRNIFLDGNTFEDSRSVDKKPLVGDLSAGVAMFWSDDFRLDASATYRSKEFDGQEGKPRHLRRLQHLLRPLRHSAAPRA